MRFPEIKEYIDLLRSAWPDDDIWLNEEQFNRENNDMSPGHYISKFGYFVVGTTVGGNAITLSDNDDNVRFCDHTGWYENELNFVVKDDYTDRPYTNDNVREAQIVISDTRDGFLNKINGAGIYDLINDYD